MNDYKYAAQLRAEEIAEEELGMDFYSLPPEKQLEVPLLIRLGILGLNPNRPARAGRRLILRSRPVEWLG